MNQSFYEIRGKEKINDLRQEGMISQAYYRSRSTVHYRLPKLIAILIGILGLAGILSR